MESIEPTVRAMEVNRVGPIGVVNEAHDCFTTLPCLDGWARCNAVVAYKASLAQVGVDLLFKGLNVDFVVVNGWTVGKGEGPIILSASTFVGLRLVTDIREGCLLRWDR